jgi:ABC-type polar amino acid transport system ATPase subunit
VRITSVRIRNYRSIKDMTVNFGDCIAICGPNSSGKSNILRAMTFALQEDCTKEEIYKNLPSSSRDTQGGPTLSIYVDLMLENITPSLADMAATNVGDTVEYTFRAIRSGTIRRKINGEQLTDIKRLRRNLNILYVPPIRDLSADGLEPFRAILANALKRARGTHSMRPVVNAARKLMKERALTILGDQRHNTEWLLGASKLGVNTRAITLDDLNEQVELTVVSGSTEQPLSEMGTGHQSAVVVNLYRQMGIESPGETIFLFEEPDNHLHPSTIRSIAYSLRDLSQKSQVIITTHSPIMIDSIDIRNVRGVYKGAKGDTQLRETSLEDYTDKEIRWFLAQYNLQVTEPMLSRRTIVVEGPFDLAIMRALFAERMGKSPEEYDIALIAGGGKGPLVKLCSMLSALGVDWYAVLDRDAAYSTEVPFTIEGLRSEDGAAADVCIELLEPVLDSDTRRGRRAIAMLEDVSEELNNGRPVERLFAGSHLEALLKLTGATLKEKNALVAALRYKKKRQTIDILANNGIWMWRGTIEQAILSKPESYEIVEEVLIKTGKLSRPLNSNRERTIQRRLKKLAYEPDIVHKIVSKLEARGLFARTEINVAVNYLEQICT